MACRPRNWHTLLDRLPLGIFSKNLMPECVLLAKRRNTWILRSINGAHYAFCNRRHPTGKYTSIRFSAFLAKQA
jgi:hypothetical protein